MPAVLVDNGDAPSATQSIELPIFDISIESAELGRKLVNAAAHWGFLWIVASSPNGADVDVDDGSYEFTEDVVDNVFSLSKNFFVDAAKEEKEASRIENNRGWVDMHIENLDPSKHSRGDFKQAFNLAEPIDGDWVQRMPATFLRQEADLKDFHARCRKTSNKLLRLISLGLEIEDPNWFVKFHEKPANTCRLLYYPEIPHDGYSQETDIRAGAHSDYGSITLLFQRPSQPGLELLTPEGKWAAVPIFPPNYHSDKLPPIVVNIGDLLSYWTNGLMKSTVHRVILTSPSKGDSDTGPEHSQSGMGEDRFSIAAFVQPHADTELGAIPSPLVAARAAAFTKEIVGHGGGARDAHGMSKMTAGDHLSSRLRATYGAAYTQVGQQAA